MSSERPPVVVARSTGSWALAIGCLVAAAALGLWVRLDHGDRPVDYDSANYAYVATRMLDHGERYLDRYNNKPPGIYAWYAGAFRLFGNDARTCHWTSLAPNLLGLLLVVPIGRALASWRVGGLAALVLAGMPPDARMAVEGYTESPLTLFALLAVLVLVRDVHDDDGNAWRAPFAAGVALGAAALFKQPAYLLAGGLAVWTTARSRDRGTATRRVAAIASGFALVGVLLVGWLQATGRLGLYLDRVFWQGAARGYADGFSVLERVEAWGRHLWMPLPVLLPFALVSLSPRAGGRAGALGLACAGPVLAMAVVSYELYLHYLIPAFPFLALAAAAHAARAQNGAGWLAAIGATHALGLAATLGLLPMHHGALGAWAEPWLAAQRPRPLSLAYQRTVADWVASRVPEGERILSTGSEIPYLARRENAYRFLGVAPYLGRLDDVGFTDFDAAASAVDVLVVERWRLALLEPDFVATLGRPGGSWREVEPLRHAEYAVYERTVQRPAPRAP